MRIDTYIHLFILSLCIACSPSDPESQTGELNEQKEWAIAIHGGSGVMERSRFADEEVELYLRSLDNALRTGERLLQEGASALDVVQVVLMRMEDDSLFNAGKGAVLTADGHAELDASIMDGLTRNCGAVTGLRTIKNPILAARLVMDSSKHVFLSRDGAEEFAMHHRLEEVDPGYFETKRRKDYYLRKKSEEVSQFLEEKAWSKFGTVGCVVLDREGNLAAGTSTGGMSMKRYGRIGDSPMIGAGTYADNTTCAVSCTGWGEYFIRAAVAHDVHARMAHGGDDLATAASEVIQKVIPELGGNGGLIAVDKT
ncbi:MAG: isoaspartyl peptidase/L-asparaginase, partial [Flavobacteriales bacterium]|nr:isoaspartyl peptidase/L-asparaginase [Flavobacteriales bacterium]